MVCFLSTDCALQSLASFTPATSVCPGAAIHSIRVFTGRLIKMSRLIEPHGGELVDLIVGEEQAEELKNQSKDWSSWDLSPRQMCDIELLLNGAFSPLRGFMNRADYESVCSTMRLADSTVWPIPITLAVSEELASSRSSGDKLALRDPEGVMRAGLNVEDACVGFIV